MHKLGIGWLQIAVFASVAAMVGPAFADLDTSSWPVAGQSRATRESVTAPRGAGRLGELRVAGAPARVLRGAR